MLCGSGDGVLLLSHQRLHVAEMKSGAEELKEYASAMSATNTAKNRDLSRLPCEWVTQGWGGMGLTCYFCLQWTSTECDWGTTETSTLMPVPSKCVQVTVRCSVVVALPLPPPPPGLQP